MDLIPWNPWSEMERVEAEIDGLLSEMLRKISQLVPGRTLAFVPDMDVVEAQDEYRLYLSLPGIVEEDLDISLEGSLLTVRGVREAPYDFSRSTVHHHQWKYGYFERRLQLPTRVSDDSIYAEYEAGVLTVRIPKGLSPAGDAGGGDASRGWQDGTVEGGPSEGGPSEGGPSEGGPSQGGPSEGG